MLRRIDGFVLPHELRLRFVARLLLVERLRGIGALLPVAVLRQQVAKQEFQKTTGMLRVGGPHRRGRLLLSGVDHRGVRERYPIEGCGLIDDCTEAACAGKQRESHVSEHRRTLYCFVLIFDGEPTIGSHSRMAN